MGIRTFISYSSANMAMKYMCRLCEVIIEDQVQQAQQKDQHRSHTMRVVHTYKVFRASTLLVTDVL